VINVQDALRPSENLTHCSTSLALTWISVGYKALFILCCSVLAFLCRNLPAAFNETRVIANCMYNIVVVGIVLIPILSSTNVDSNTQFWVRSLCILGVNVAIQSIFLIPKLLNPMGRGLITETVQRSQGQSMFGSKYGTTSTKSGGKSGRASAGTTNSVASGSHASIHEDDADGTDGEALKRNGNGNAPRDSRTEMTASGNSKAINSI